MFNMGFQELLILGIIAVLLFGKRLPEVARSLGNSYQQFRRGLQDIQGEVDSVVRSANSAVPARSQRYLSQSDDLDEPTAPAFVPPDEEINEEADERTGD